jgi:ATP-dependent DNA helicase HFM1/MER3
MSGSDLMQMIGRAGRPQFDTRGVAIVMTSTDKKAEYSGLVQGKIIESNLFPKMIEHLNAEIVAGGTATKDSCMR